MMHFKPDYALINLKTQVKIYGKDGDKGPSYFLEDSKSLMTINQAVVDSCLDGNARRDFILVQSFDLEKNRIWGRGGISVYQPNGGWIGKFGDLQDAERRINLLTSMRQAPTPEEIEENRRAYRRRILMEEQVVGQIADAKATERLQWLEKQDQERRQLEKDRGLSWGSWS